MFSSEAALVRAYRRYLNKSLPKRARFVCEFEAGHGIADIVLFSRKKSISKEISSEFSRLPPRFAYLLGEDRLPKEFSRSDFRALSGVSAQTAIRVLSELVKRGFLKQQKIGLYRRIKAIHCPIETVVSIEAKLEKWNHAIRQAYRYKEFSHQSWVLLDEGRASSALRNLDRFVVMGVGLATIDTSRVVRIYYAPSFENPISEIRYWTACVNLEKLSKKIK
jgi:hypothetical protein